MTLPSENPSSPRCRRQRARHGAGAVDHAGAGASMVENLPSPAARARADEPSQAIFQQEWRIYRMVIDANYLFHREAYTCLHQILVEEMHRPFCFLDIACGDAAESVGALTGTPIAHYYGIDLSAAVLDLAR